MIKHAVPYVREWLRHDAFGRFVSINNEES